MESTISRVSTSFNLRTDVLDILKKKARSSHRTLDAYVEDVLLDDAYTDEPNTETRCAIMEAKEGNRDGNEVYDNIDALMAGLMGA